ncbi:MAG TPA: pitrilysin family protein [Anaerolineae bacterium]
MPLDPKSIPGPANIARREYANGMTVLVKENFSSPSVVVDGLIRASSADDPIGQEGLSSFTTDMLMRGTARRSFAQIYETIEAIGASVDISSGVNVSMFGTKSLAEDLGLVVDVLADVLRRPAFPEAELEKVRGEILTSLEERANDTRRMASLTFREILYPQGHPYARSTQGYVATVKSITRDDLLNFYRSRYGAQGLIVSIAGAVKTEEAFKTWEAAFGDWIGAAIDRGLIPDAPHLNEKCEKRVDVPGKVQSDVVLGFVGPTRSAPEYLDVRLANSILGVFGLYGRIGEKVREKGGLAYYSYSRVEGGLGPGAWNVVAGVDPANVDKAIPLIQGEIKRMCETKVTAKELKDNKSYSIGSMPLSLETNDGVAGIILDMELYGLGLDYLIRYPDLINSITAARIQAAARKYLDPDNFALAVAGPQ